MANYWQDRMQASQVALANKSRKEVDRQIKKYYIKLSKQIISEYEALYNEVLVKKAAGEAISPATLYKMDKYWQMQQQIRTQLKNTGAHLQKLMSSVFEFFYKKSYNSLKIDGVPLFSTIDDNAVKQIINSIWTADGQSWSQRIWNDMTLLQETLEEGLLEAVTTGKKTSDLKKTLQQKFNVSYNRADTLVRTEMAHIQTEAAKQRYNDYGIKEVEIWADPDERTCPTCSKLHRKRYPVGAQVPIPAHPRCRCCIVPVVDTSKYVIKDLDNN